MKIDYMVEAFKEIEMEISSVQAKQLYTFYEMMIEKNKVMNLTGIVEYEEVVRKHFIDSVYGIEKYLKPRMRILDLGTGAGFPGMPIKIISPEIDMVLLDSLKKRLVFLDEVIEALALTKVATLHGRAEDYGQSVEYREKFDLVVSRAVANLASLSEYALPYVRVNGRFIAYKSGNIKEELAMSNNAIAILGAEVEDIIQFQLPGTDIERTLVVLHKVRNTAKKYPRKAGLPTKEPIS